jgi:hypothetical protein
VSDFETVILAAVLGNVAISLLNKHVWIEVDKLIDKFKKRVYKKKINRKKEVKK